MTMQDEPWLLWRMEIGGLVGFVSFALAASAAIWLRRRRRAQEKERPPQTTNLLRPPGYSLQQRLETLNDNWYDSALQLMLFGGLSGACVATWIPLVLAILHRPALAGELLATPFPRRWPFLVFSILTMAALWLAVRGLRRMLKTAEKLRACRLGLRGEQAVAEALNTGSLAAAGYMGFHDIPGDGDWNIDHVVVGPGGVFVIETKSRSRRKAKIKQEEHVVTFDGQTLRFPWCQDQKAARQAARNAEWLQKFLNGYAPGNLTVQPIVVVPGWWAEALGNYPVKVMNAKYLITFLSKAPHQFTSEQLKPLLLRLDERCRTVEF
jgi:membrane protein implicated in regulation of membrane protease activity